MVCAYVAGKINDFFTLHLSTVYQYRLLLSLVK